MVQASLSISSVEAEQVLNRHQRISAAQKRAAARMSTRGMTRISGSEALNPDRCALRMIVTVVSTPTADRIIVDGGAKTFTSYPPTPYGHIIGQPDVKIYGMSVEHGHLDVSESQHKFRVGDQLAVIPLHQGMTSNLHDELVAVRNEQVETVWKNRRARQSQIATANQTEFQRL